MSFLQPYLKSFRSPEPLVRRNRSGASELRHDRGETQYHPDLAGFVDLCALNEWFEVTVDRDGDMVKGIMYCFDKSGRTQCVNYMAWDRHLGLAWTTVDL